MKTKMRTILSVCMLTALLYACTKNNSPAPLDCMRIENGTAISDDCGDCHKWMVYNTQTHESREVNDTNEVLVYPEIYASPNSPYNLAWNACPDCNGISNGVALMDSCGVCHQSYVYDFSTHIPAYIEDTVGLVLGATEMLILAGSPQDIANNPNWNACDSIARP